MQKKHIILVLSLLVVLVAGMFGFAYLSRTQIERESTETPAPVAETAENATDTTTITAKHYYTDPPGVHTLAGEMLMPTACDLISNNVVLLDNGTRAVVSFDVINNATNCEQKPTSQRFKIGFQASKDIKIEAVYKGKPVELNLIPAKEGESPADFELHIKG